MKRFLYYNQDSVNSLLAQIEKGILIKEESEKQKSEATSSSTGFESGVAGDLGAKVFGIGATLKGELSSTVSDEEVTSQMIRSVQEKALHDFAFEKVSDYILSNNMIHNDSPQIGDFISIEETPTFLDFDYFVRLFADDGALKIISDQHLKQIKDLKKGVPKGAKIPPELSIQIKELENEASSSEDERKETGKTITAIRNTLPYNHFVLTDSFLIPLEDSNFRDDPKIVSFKYGGRLSIFGYVTNIITNEEDAVYKNDFAPLYNEINKLMLGFVKGKSLLYSVHPIAIYY